MASKQTKAALIEKHGTEWYDAYLKKERIRRRERYAKNPEYTRQYNREHRDIYRINIRDRNRLTLLRGMNLDGKELHHIAYHANNDDPAWEDDIMILTPEEHRAWHTEHPDFVAREHIVY